MMREAVRLFMVVAFISTMVFKSSEFESDDMSAAAVAAQLLDTNGDGIIDRAELAAAIAEVRLGGGKSVLSAPRAAPPRQMQTLGIAPGVEVGADGAYVDCPCIDHVHDTHWAAVISTYVVHSNDAVNLNTINGMYPRDYGSAHCRAWDIDGTGLPACRKTRGAPEQCSHRWCYVNKSRCGRSVLAWSYFSGLAVSYTTCGNIGAPSFDVSWEALSPLYAVDLREFDLWTRPSPQPPDGPVGLRLMTIFAFHVIRSMSIPGGTLRYRALSNASKLAYSSPYTACVHDINLGNIDVCFGDWWFTSARTHMKFNFIPIFSTSMKLLVKKVTMKTEETTWDAVRKTFDVFRWDLWLEIILMLAFASVIMAIVDKERIHCGQLTHCRCPTFKKSVYETALTLASFSNSYTPVTPAGKVLGLGIAFFITITGASFTANLAQSLISEAQKPEQYKGLADLLEAEERVCVDPDMIEEIDQAYPRLSARAVLMDPGKEVQGIIDGRCRGAIVSEFELGAIDASVACDVEFVGGIIHQYPTGFYTTPEFGDMLKYYVSLKTSDGTWASVKMKNVPEPSCSDMSMESEDKQNEGFELRPSHMWGNVFILLTTCGLALLMHSCVFKEAVETASRRHIDVEVIEEKADTSCESPPSVPGELAPGMESCDGMTTDMLPPAVLSELALRMETLERSITEVNDEMTSTSLSSVHSDLVLRIDRLDRKMATVGDDRVSMSGKSLASSASASYDLALRMDREESTLKARGSIFVHPSSHTAVVADPPQVGWAAVSNFLHFNDMQPQCEPPL